MRIAVTSIIDLERSAHNRLHELLRGLVKHHEVTVFGIQDWWKGGQVDAGQYRAGVEDILEALTFVPYTTRAVSPILQEAIGAANAPRLLRNRTFDVHFDYNTLLSGMRFAGVLSRRGVPSVYDLADDLVAMVQASPQIPVPFRWGAGRAAEFALRRNLRRARAVTAINRALAEQARTHASRVHLLPNGVDTALFSPCGDDLRRSWGLEGELVLGYVGVLREWVDFSPVLEAMAAMKEEKRPGSPKLVVVGEEGGAAPTRRMAKRLGVEDDVLWTGTIPYKDVPRHVAAFDAGLIPFDAGKISANSLPLKLFEYAAMGKAVIASPLRAIRDLDPPGVLYASNGAEYAEAFARVHKDGRHHAPEARQWVLDRFSWQAIGQQLRLLLENAPGAAPEPRAPRRAAP